MLEVEITEAEGTLSGGYIAKTNRELGVSNGAEG